MKGIVQDDLPTLEKMIEDMDHASSEWKPTNYWKYYERESLNLIRSSGIRDFRSPRFQTFKSFGTRADDSTLSAIYSITNHWLGKSTFAIGRRLPGFSNFFRLFDNLTRRYVTDRKNILRLYYEYCALMDTENVLAGIGDSLLGSPDIVLNADERYYTSSFLIYFAQYLFVKANCDFKRIQNVLEIGGGYGGQAEVMLKARPDVRYVNIDIPPQIYISNQYLSACFEDQVVGYQETRNLDKIGFDMFPEARIITLCPWQLPKLRGSFDLFWNSASFQEMEPEIVSNYSKYVRKLTKKYIYLRALERGKRPAKRSGELGVLKRTTKEDYFTYFTPQFELIAERVCGPLEFIEQRTGYVDLIFQRL